MKLIESGSDENELWIVVETETPLTAGNFKEFLLGKIKVLDGVICPTDVPNQYKVSYDDMYLHSPEEYYAPVHIMKAYAVSDAFEHVKHKPCDFPQCLFDGIEQHGKENGYTIKATSQADFIQIQFFDPEGNLNATYTNSIVSAYMDYLLFDTIRGYFIEDVNGNCGAYGGEKTEAYVKDLNAKLSASANAVQLEIGTSFFTGKDFVVVIAKAGGRAVETRVPMGVIGFMAENEIELQYSVECTDEFISLEIDWSTMLPPAYMETWKTHNWSILRHVGQVK